MFKILSRLILTIGSSRITRSMKLKNIAHKLFTIALVLFYFEYLKQVPPEQRLAQNDTELLNFVASQHIISCLPLFAKRLLPRAFTILVLILLGASVIVWPFLTWYGFIIDSTQTDYWTIRYLFQLGYILVMQCMRIDGLDTIQQLFGEGFLLS